MKYYYLVASLPVLALGEPAPCTAAEFRARCEGVLSPVDARELRGLLEGRAGEAQSAFARGWFAADTQLRNAAARLRATPLAVEAKGFLREHPGFTAALEKAVVDAFAKPHPGERELELDRCRWLVADELAREDAFGLPTVLAFAIKLQLAERWAALTDEAGGRRLEELVDRMGRQE